jgi:uncharacterized RmlC-like cupin family protein
MLKRLREDCKVKPFIIIQYLGDAIFIPAGAPHQVYKRSNILTMRPTFKYMSDLIIFFTFL